MQPALPFIFMGAILTGCAARSLPAKFPKGSAASTATAEAPKPSVLTTLRADPPLPGEPDSDWAGLEDSAPAQSQIDAPAPVAETPPATVTTDNRQRPGQ
jgi:hypothetical protein